MMMDNDFPMVYRPEEEKGPKFEKLPADANKQDEAIEYLRNYKDRMSADSSSSDPFMVLRTPEGKRTLPKEEFFADWMQQRFGPIREASAPSFDLSYPKIPGRNVEGIPNANDPVMREKLRQRLLRNPEGGQELPGFLKRV
jgi:hypothetical protein